MKWVGPKLGRILDWVSFFLYRQADRLYRRANYHRIR